MIFDRLERAEAYRCLSAEIAQALGYLRGADFTAMPDGRHEIDGDRLFAMVSRYRPKQPAEAVWESHRQYVDVQYLAQGTELIGYAPLTKDTVVRQQYDQQQDVALYDIKGDFLTLVPGSFVIFMPQDIHAPGLAPPSASPAAEVLKVVVKCRLP